MLEVFIQQPPMPHPYAQFSQIASAAASTSFSRTGPSLLSTPLLVPQPHHHPLSSAPPLQVKADNEENLFCNSGSFVMLAKPASFSSRPNPLMRWSAPLHRLFRIRSPLSKRHGQPRSVCQWRRKQGWGRQLGIRPMLFEHIAQLNPYTLWIVCGLDLFFPNNLMQAGVCKVV